MFKNGKQQRSFEELKRQIETAQRQLSAPTAVAPAASSMDELEKLAGLKDRGIVTEQEFEQKKRQLLGL